VLTVPAGEYVALAGITITDGNNTSTNTGGGLNNSGTVTITGSTFTGNTTGDDGGAIDNADGNHGGPGTGSVTVTASTFTGNTATWDGGAIDNADGNNDSSSGSVAVTASTFTGNTARVGGAIASGLWGGGGTAAVTASTFTGNRAQVDAASGLGGYGGAIGIGYGGNGTAAVTASTFSRNTAKVGAAIASGGNGGGGTMTVAGDLFDGSCTQGVGPWTDGGYNAGTDKSCFASTPRPVTPLAARWAATCRPP
jgi:hypothetical protein